MQSCVYPVDAECRRIHYPVRVDPYDIFLQVICAETAVQDDLPRRLRYVYAAQTIHSDSVAQILERIEAYLAGERAKESEVKHLARRRQTARGLYLLLPFLQRDDAEKVAALYYRFHFTALAASESPLQPCQPSCARVR